VEDPSSSQHCQKAKKSAPKTTTRPDAKPFLLTQNHFPAKSIYKDVVDNESYFTVDGNEWQLQSYYESENHPATEDVKFIRKNKFPVKVLLWLAVRGISEPVLF
jgi:hypothetical protein